MSPCWVSGGPCDAPTRLYGGDISAGPLSLWALIAWARRDLLWRSNLWREWLYKNVYRTSRWQRPRLEFPEIPFTQRQLIALNSLRNTYARTMCGCTRGGGDLWVWPCTSRVQRLAPLFGTEGHLVHCSPNQGGSPPPVPAFTTQKKLRLCRYCRTGPTIAAWGGRVSPKFPYLFFRENPPTSGEKWRFEKPFRPWRSSLLWWWVHRIPRKTAAGTMWSFQASSPPCSSQKCAPLSQVVRPKWTKLDLFRPKRTKKMIYFGPFSSHSLHHNCSAILSQIGPARLPAVLQPLLTLGQCSAEEPSGLLLPSPTKSTNPRPFQANFLPGYGKFRKPCGDWNHQMVPQRSRGKSCKIDESSAKLREPLCPLKGSFPQDVQRRWSTTSMHFEGRIPGRETPGQMAPSRTPKADVRSLFYSRLFVLTL